MIKDISRENLGVIFITLAFLVAVYALFLNSKYPDQTRLFAPKDALSFIWNNYKKNYIEVESGRTLDRQSGDITTSEGISYSLLRAVYSDDKVTFEKTLTWANQNLKRENDNLFSWLYGKKIDGTYGIITERGGQNTASDADSDIALALIFASERWGDPRYLEQAKNILNDMWKYDVVQIKNVPYLAADDIEYLAKENYVINVSYFSPYAYKIFAKVDPTHNWNDLVDSSYGLLLRSTEDKLDKESSASLPPDWLTISKSSGEIVPNSNDLNTTNTTNYSYDALRVPFRIALDYEWFGDPRAKNYLSRLGFLGNEWKSRKKLASVYLHNGGIVSEKESPAMYAGSFGYFWIMDKASAKEIYDKKIVYLYDIDINDWKTQLSYYDDNWTWFAISLYNGQLPNLAKNYIPYNK